MCYVCCILHGGATIPQQACLQRQCLNRFYLTSATIILICQRNELMQLVLPEISD